MSFTVQIKEEISHIDSTKSEKIAELSGYIRNNSSIVKNKIIMTTENIFNVDRVVFSVKELFHIEAKVEIIGNVNFSKNSLYQIMIDDSNYQIRETLGICNEKHKKLDVVPDYIVGANEEIRAYLRGVFASSGSINDPKTSRYHMELLIDTPNESVFVQKLLNLFDLNAKILNRDKGYMIYIKEAEKISDFIKILGANKAVMYFENIRVYRNQKNKTNRLNNCEQANMDKIIQTANDQLNHIKVIEDNDALDLLDDKAKEALEYRKKYPESSLKELAEIISLETNKSITKSGLNHRMRKIKDLAERLMKNN